MDKTSTRKRTHLSSTQVSVLECSFQENSLPDSSIRSRLAKKLSVSERTVQIWFQNRRAKQKKMKMYLRDQKQDLPRYQPTFRSLVTPKAFEEPQLQTIRKRPRSISKPEPKSLQLLSDIEIMQQNQRAMSEDLTISQISSLGQIHQAPIEIIPLQPSVLRIGTWTRFSSEQEELEWDLSCDILLSNRIFVWKIRIGEHQFKIEIGFDQIQYIHLQHTGQLDIHVRLPLSFKMLRFQQDQDWVSCGDFTEDQQASIVPVHSLQGNYELFKNALFDIMLLAPELSTKMINTLPGLDVCREYTLSPSATPEPFMMQYTNEPTKGSEDPTLDTNHNLMLQAPFFYSTVSPSDIDQEASDILTTPPSPFNSLYKAYVSF
ncbi:hypothetical protein G6F46_003710 [Rhizopus delemar]|uniref:Homeobox domain-containing protein n=3 Tax=Rhizopus TaxID=4842 RepID=I1BJ12_RHIO9|nr:hypothetical protein RO3G_00896 [Rhizopus delemar RA 99-880]KAG1053375.1 hypothetical protein G6F43_004541 [Rhizopus delemar]KAG1548041.1 hypothetical protein G6F51_003900 [Rhizopus arrhizus]KAG1448203.1 hypothetical protein G6F55_010752 [Rhizopus delemar]KAG1501260.1 hypothetical protein G6F54_003160 [Rhizopus delemar]|eukprot:EIE76192.1 hypothetical protein RO3G_00896 [Rhizopus delemar RA 99-880]